MACAVAMGGVLVACGNGQDTCPVADRATCEPLQRGWIDRSGQLRGYVVDSIQLPATAAEPTKATKDGFDLDGDKDSLSFDLGFTAVPASF